MIPTCWKHFMSEHHTIFILIVWLPNIEITNKWLHTFYQCPITFMAQCNERLLVFSEFVSCVLCSWWRLGPLVCWLWAPYTSTCSLICERIANLVDFLGWESQFVARVVYYFVFQRQRFSPLFAVVGVVVVVVVLIARTSYVASDCVLCVLTMATALSSAGWHS